MSAVPCTDRGAHGRGHAAGAAFAPGGIAPHLVAVQPSDLWSVAAPLVCLLLACTMSAARIDPILALRSD